MLYKGRVIPKKAIKPVDVRLIYRYGTFSKINDKDFANIDSEDKVILTDYLKSLSNKITEYETFQIDDEEIIKILIPGFYLLFGIVLLVLLMSITCCVIYYVQNFYRTGVILLLFKYLIVVKSCKTFPPSSLQSERVPSEIQKSNPIDYLSSQSSRLSKTKSGRHRSEQGE